MSLRARVERLRQQHQAEAALSAVLRQRLATARTRMRRFAEDEGRLAEYDAEQRRLEDLAERDPIGDGSIASRILAARRRAERVLQEGA